MKITVFIITVYFRSLDKHPAVVIFGNLLIECWNFCWYSRIFVLMWVTKRQSNFSCFLFFFNWDGSKFSFCNWVWKQKFLSKFGLNSSCSTCGFCLNYSSDRGHFMIFYYCIVRSTPNTNTFSQVLGLIPA